MDQPPLPDDPRDWPTDPFALLGVPRSVGEADLKRAYTRLIRRYKPEHAPDEFRRIRAAYEAAVEMSRWYREAPARNTFGDLPVTAPDPAVLAPRDRPAPAHRTRIDPPVRPVSVDPVEVAWAEAVSGRWADAYAALVTLTEQSPERGDLPLRLYWLLALRPTLDDARTRHHWLAVSLGRSRLGGPAVELYRRELAADPQAALNGPYARLLEVERVPGDRLFALAAARLAAAGPERRWAAVELDLAVLAARAPDLDETAWLGYLVEFYARTAFDQPSAFGRCAELIAGLKHLELSQGWAFDLLDERQALIVGKLRAALLPDPIRRALVAAAVGGTGWKELKAAVAWAANDPGAALLACDAWSASRTHLDLLVTFDRLVESYRRERPADTVYPSHLIRGAVRASGVVRHFGRDPLHTRQDYTRVRPLLLLFLLAQRIDPDELVSACFIDSNADSRTVVQYVRNDQILRLVYRMASAAH